MATYGLFHFRPQKFLPNVQKRISSLFKDKQDKSKKGKDPKQQQQQQVQGENTQAKLKRQQLTRQQQQQVMLEDKHYTKLIINCYHSVIHTDY